ncbi:MAG: hypothetical protein AB8H80_23180 [Planctomycetota bacterium]
MTETGNLASLEPLEPLEAAAAPAVQQDPLAHNRGGLAAPAHNMFCADKSFYRFLFAGVVMLVACWMPMTAELLRPAYMTMAGGFYMLIAIAMIWSWWASIANNRPMGVKWLLFTAAPLIGSVWALIAFDVQVAAETAKGFGWIHPDMPYSDGWGGMFSDLGATLAKDPDTGIRVEGFFRLLGPANIFLLLGSLMAELGFIMGVLGGAKQNKIATQQKRMKAAEKRRK